MRLPSTKWGNRPLRIALLAAMLLGAAAQHASAQGRAMVLAVAGETLPPLLEYQVLRLPARIALQAGAELEIADFDHCRILRIPGSGTLELAARAGFSGNGRMTAEPGQCATELQIGAAPSEQGGVTLRVIAPSDRPAQEEQRPISARPSIAVLAPDRFPDHQLIIEKTDGTVRIRVPLDAPLLTWPPDGPSLPPGSYRFSVAPSASAAAGGGGSGGFTAEIAEGSQVSPFITIDGAAF